MPTFTRSSFNLGGSYQPDAMDQVEQWNANRGDQWSRYAMDSQKERTADDWRKEVALKQLGLQSEMYQGWRADTAAARQAEADRWQKQFGYMQGKDTMENERWGKQFGLQERAANLQLNEADRLAQERAAEAAALESVDPTQLGFTDPKAIAAWKALPAAARKGVIPNLFARTMERSMLPEDRATRGEDVRGTMALEALSKYEQQGQVTPREAQQYAKASAEAQKQGYGGTGGAEPQQIKAQEFAKQQARAIIKQADDLAGGLMGYASEADIQAIADATDDLASIMERAGYKPDDINAVMQEIQARLEKVNANDFRTATR